MSGAKQQPPHALSRPKDGQLPPSAQARAGVHRLRLLDLLRLTAALMVLGYHYFARAPVEVWEERREAIPALVLRTTAYGALGVQLFFIISGFVIALSLSGRTRADFVASRVARLFPAYIVAVGLVLLLPQQLKAFHPSALPEYLVNLSMLQIPVGVSSLSGVYWTLWVEATFYILMAVVAGRSGLSYNKLVAVAFFWPLLGLYAQNLRVYPLATFLQADNAALFSGGICIYLLYRYGHSLLTWSLLLANAGLSSWRVSTGGFLTSMENNTRQDLSSTITAALILSFFVAVYLASTPRFRGRGWKILTTAGALTYPLYLIHEEWGWYAISVSPRNLHPLATAAIVAGVVLVVAYLIHRFVERPIGPRIRRGISASFARARAQEAAGVPGTPAVSSPAGTPRDTRGPSAGAAEGGSDAKTL